MGKNGGGAALWQSTSECDAEIFSRDYRMGII
jgi:hypothetical protein